MPSRKVPHPPRLCVTCDVGFVPSHGRQRYCSPRCVGYRRTKELADCPHCGEQFLRTHGNRRFCSTECLDAFHKPPRLSEKPCAFCGTVTLRHKFCSDECSEKARRYRPSPQVCEGCGESFWRRGHKHPLCPSCKPKPPVPKVRYRRVTKGKIWMRVKTQPKPREFVAGDCPCCGESFVAFAWTGSQFCSPGCQRREERRRRRDVKRQSEKAEPIFRRKVYERDNWTCRLCKKPVAQDAVVPHPKAPTLDHILPLSLGGSHTYTNVQCAHFICNSKKSANVIQLSFAA